MVQKRKTLKEGSRFERYIITRKLGEGGMGAVYRAYHPALNTSYALKILFPDIAKRNSEFVDRFVREARIASTLRHSNLIGVHDAGRDIQNGMYYLVMDYADGGSVRTKLNQQGCFSPEEAISVVLQVLSALTEAEKSNMVHRDIKPDNIMFTSSGVVKLADLGIAKANNEEEVTLTMGSSIFGTPAYMSPQQAYDAKNVDCRADIYSLGIVFYEMLTGFCPYRGTPMSIIAKVVTPEEIPDVREANPEIPEDIARIIRKMCAKKLEERYQTPGEALDALGQLLDPETPLEKFFSHITEQDHRKDNDEKSASSVVVSREMWEKEWLRHRKQKQISCIAGGILLILSVICGIVLFISYSGEKKDEQEAMQLEQIKTEADQRAELIKSENQKAEQQIKSLHYALEKQKQEVQSTHTKTQRQIQVLRSLAEQQEKKAKGENEKNEKRIRELEKQLKEEAVSLKNADKGNDIAELEKQLEQKRQKSRQEKEAAEKQIRDLEEQLRNLQK